MGGAVFLSSFKGPFGHVLKPILGFFLVFNFLKVAPSIGGACFLIIECPHGLVQTHFRVLCLKFFKVAPLSRGRWFFNFLNAHWACFQTRSGYFLSFLRLPPEWGAHIFHFPIVIGSLPSNFELWQGQVVGGSDRPGPLLIMYFLWQKKINIFMYKTVPSSCYFRFSPNMGRSENQIIEFWAKLPAVIIWIMSGFQTSRFIFSPCGIEWFKLVH